MDEWELVKNYYKYNLGISCEVVEFLAVVDILTMCALGKSNENIALAFDFDKEYVQEVCREFFRFDGFERDLDFNSRDLYQRHKYNKYTYLIRAGDCDKITNPELLKESYRINIMLDIILNRIEKEYK